MMWQPARVAWAEMDLQVVIDSDLLDQQRDTLENYFWFTDVEVPRPAILIAKLIQETHPRYFAT